MCTQHLPILTGTSRMGGVRRIWTRENLSDNEIRPPRHNARVDDTGDFVSNLHRQCRWLGRQSFATAKNIHLDGTVCCFLLFPDARFSSAAGATHTLLAARAVAHLAGVVF